jgi:hypothetical protein
MLGRGCRSQGKASGTIVIVNNQYLRSEHAWQEIKSRAQIFDADVIKNLRPLYNALPYADSALLLQAKKVYADNKWRIPYQSFLNNNGGLIARLRRSELQASERDLIPCSQQDVQQ